MNSPAVKELTENIIHYSEFSMLYRCIINEVVRISDHPIRMEIWGNENANLLRLAKLQ